MTGARLLAAALCAATLLAATACSSGAERAGTTPARTVQEPPRRAIESARTPARPSRGAGQRTAYAPVRWRLSRSLGLPYAGRLVNGVLLPPEGEHFFTWDPVRHRAPNRAWRRFGSDRLVRTLLKVLEEYAAAHPEAPRVAIGDLSRPRGGDFGPRYGKPGHASHQNGLDVDIYYPRKDRLEFEPLYVRDVDRELAQDLVDRFVRAGAKFVFVGLRVGLTGPPRIVQRIPYHDNHLHVRLPADPRRRVLLSAVKDRKQQSVARSPGHTYLLGRTTAGRPIRAHRVGPADDGRRRVLVVGCIHGTECAGTSITRRLATSRVAGELWLVHNLNPDGLAAGRRQNGRGVDLNRNFPSGWQAIGVRWDPQYSGPRPFSEPETRIARDLIRRLRPRVTIWYHQPQALVRAWGPSIPVARRYARLAGTRFRAIRWPAGTAPNWQNHRFRGTTSFVVELPAGPLPALAAARHARAIVGLVRRPAE